MLLNCYFKSFVLMKDISYCHHSIIYINKIVGVVRVNSDIVVREKVAMIYELSDEVASLSNCLLSSILLGGFCPRYKSIMV